MSAPEPERPIRLLSPLFWAAMIFCLLCFVGAGYVTLSALHRAEHRSTALGDHPHPR